MGRRKGRKGNNPPAILIGNKHHHNCLCDRCLDNDTTQLERELERAWEAHNKGQGVALPKINLTTKESPIIGPFDGKDTNDAVSVNCPMAIVFYITPKGKRRK